MTSNARGSLLVCALLTVVAGLGTSRPTLAAPQEENDVSREEHDKRVDYIEFLSTDLAATKQFYGAVFGWTFEDWGDDYVSFADGRLAGGFHRADEVTKGGPLVILYAVDLEGVETAVREHGGEIVKEIFPFPGGRRFHFSDPSGNELAVWSDG